MMEPANVSQIMNGITIVRSARFLIALKSMLLVIRIMKVNVYAILVIGGVSELPGVRNKLFWTFSPSNFKHKLINVNITFL